MGAAITSAATAAPKPPAGRARGSGQSIAAFAAKRNMRGGRGAGRP